MRLITLIICVLTGLNAASQNTAVFGVRGNDSIIIFLQGADTVSVEKWDVNHRYYGFGIQNVDISEQPLKSVIKTAKNYIDNKKPEYPTGSAAVVTQQTSKITPVNINAICGRITTHNAALAAGAEAKFTVNNSFVSENDFVMVNIKGGGTSGNYMACVTGTATGFFDITISNVSTGSLSQALQINFIIIKLN